MKILKFGGTSLGNAQRIKQAAKIISSEAHCIVACSAMAGVTDTLLRISEYHKKDNLECIIEKKAGLRQFFEEICRELFREQAWVSEARDLIAFHFEEMSQWLESPFKEGKEKQLLSYGEIITSKLLELYVKMNFDREVRLLDALKFLQLNEAGEPSISGIRQQLEKHYGPLGRGRYITQGFICLNHSGEISNLQRGGSDYTATLLGAAFNSSSIEIWTDVDGLRNNDPRFVENTMLVRRISFAEAAELAYFGAKILHPSCVWPASKKNIPIFLKNTLNPNSPGTIISGTVGASHIRAISAKDGISMIRIQSARMLNAYGFLRKVFEVFDKWKTPIDVITTSEVSVSLTIDNPSYLEEITESLQRFGKVFIERDQAILCIVGDVLACQQAYAGQVMKALKPFQIKMLSFGGSRNNLTIVLPGKEKKGALQALQQQLFLQTPNPLFV